MNKFIWKVTWNEPKLDVVIHVYADVSISPENKNQKHLISTSNGSDTTSAEAIAQL
jgi:hypothetical protein